MTVHLAFGLSEAVPEDASAAWGARWIVTQDGTVDQLPDRMGLWGVAEPEKALLLDHLNTVVRRQPHDEMRRLLRDGEVSTREAKRVVLYEDDIVAVAADTKGSAGYAYVAAWVKAPVQP